MKNEILVLILVFIVSLNVFSQDAYMSRTIYGVILDERNQPLPAATIMVKGTTYGVSSDLEGKFCLVIPKNQDVIIEWAYMCPNYIEVIKSKDKVLKYKLGKVICGRKNIYNKLSNSSDYEKMINEFYNSEEFKNNKKCN